MIRVIRVTNYVKQYREAVMAQQIHDKRNKQREINHLQRKISAINDPLMKKLHKIAESTTVKPRAVHRRTMAENGSGYDSPHGKVHEVRNSTYMVSSGTNCYII